MTAREIREQIQGLDSEIQAIERRYREFPGFMPEATLSRLWSMRDQRSSLRSQLRIAEVIG